MTDFQREERYVVIKISKMHPHPAFRAKHLSALKRENGDALVDCVVVERDWPEYEHVWSMLESRITGAPKLDHINCHSTIRKQSEQIDTLRAQLAEAHAVLRLIPRRSTPYDRNIDAVLSASAEPSALPDPLGCNECTHAECGGFDGPRQVECRAMADNACARPGASS